MRNEEDTTSPVAGGATATATAAPGVIDYAPTTERELDRRWVTGALMLVMVLASMEQTVTSTAMPTIIGDLHGLEHYSWVASIYLLACTVTMPLYGRLADALGRKRVIVGSILLFMAGSVLAAYAHSMTQLIVYRGLQGLGAGGIMPVVLTILGDIFTLEERAKIQGFFSAVWGTASLAGPALGAFLVGGFGWRAVFLINLPLGAMGLGVLIWKYHDQQKAHPMDLDLPGLGALATACMALLALVSRLGPDGWSWPAIAALTATTVVATLFFVWHERRTSNPILPPALIMRRAIGPSIAASFLFGLGFLCLDTYVPLYVQGGRGGGVAAAASVVTPIMFTWALSAMVGAPLLVRWGFRKTALAGASLIVLGFVGLLICAKLAAPHWVLTGVLALTGFGFGPASMSYLLAAQDDVEWQQRGIVTSAVGFFRTIGGALGVGLLGAMFNAIVAKDLDRLRAAGVTPATLLDPHASTALPPALAADAHRTIAAGLTWVFVAMLVAVIVQWAITCLMPARSCNHTVKVSEGMEAMAG